MKFNYYLPVNLIFGQGMLNELGTQTVLYGKKALLVTGKNSTKKTGLLDKSIALLNKAGVQTIVFDKVEQNPLTTTIENGVVLAKSYNCDVIVGIGGGSIMDASKAIAFSVKNSGDISKYIFGEKTGTEALPIVLVPTTAGTGSEGNCFAVLTNPETLDKKSLRTNLIIPKCSIVDPMLMTTMPKNIIASVGFDALCHNIEAYTSNITQPFVEIQSLYGINLIAKSLLKVYENPEDVVSWEDVTLASTLGGMEINMAGVTAAHGMEHPVSGLYNVVHGHGLAALTPIVIEKTYRCSEEKFSNISKALGGTSASDCANTVRNLLEKLNLTYSLSALGVKEKDIDWLAENCIKVSLPSIKNNPKVFTTDEIKEIYRTAL